MLVLIFDRRQSRLYVDRSKDTTVFLPLLINSIHILNANVVVSIYAWLNDGVDPNFHWTDAGQIANGQCHIDHLRFTDLTGSGKAAFVCIDIKDGSVTAWFNNWSALGPKWDGPHKISGTVAGGNINSIFYMDING